jgi:hypothetical protein
MFLAEDAVMEHLQLLDISFSFPFYIFVYVIPLRLNHIVGALRVIEFTWVSFFLDLFSQGRRIYLGSFFWIDLFWKLTSKTNIEILRGPFNIFVEISI